MKLQISCSLTFDKQLDRDGVFSYLHGKKDIAFAEKGDFLTMENAIDGSFRVACTYRLAKQADRDEIETFLTSKKDKARADKLSHIEKHTCEHEEGKPCHSQVANVWGGEL